ncbi:DUF397 domain-containing protein [Nocardiopsis dassonvillei]|uniref:DUF397 domain-containing protein n=1 Tax=Nocardiopsis dassonvillei TaxID=2014 RepID=UPI00200F3562|nr:DUF397 domain-containing protein [Nocardiopsis dassonvillei]MCK9870168.1 DUF397 domain-containing protein [Nocardiopsis dassonvillei]
MTDGFHKSTYSNDGGHCVEVREHSNGADVRDTQNRDKGTLAFPANEWRALLEAAQDL